MGKDTKKFLELIAIMKRLRSPEGCPWDREQDMSTLKSYVVEETYEVLEAIDRNSPHELKEELGDLLLQIVFLSELAEEKGFFDINDVITAIVDKMIRRHPHVFGSKNFKTSEEVLDHWSEIKREEGKESVISGVPRHLPSLLQAYRLTEKASRVGFDWESLTEVMKKLNEEMGEFSDALRSKDKEKIEKEIGDLLFAVVNVSRHLGISSEEALRKANKRFISRFQYIEESLKKEKKDIRKTPLDEMDRLWEEAKVKNEGGK
jgi:tetrapyrrole methylase family protein/MazG family protein